MSIIPIQMHRILQTTILCPTVPQCSPSKNALLPGGSLSGEQSFYDCDLKLSPLIQHKKSKHVISYLFIYLLPFSPFLTSLFPEPSLVSPSFIFTFGFLKLLLGILGSGFMSSLGVSPAASATASGFLWVYGAGLFRFSASASSSFS